MLDAHVSGSDSAFAPPIGILAHSRPSDTSVTVDVTRDDVDVMILYLDKARARAVRIRENAPAGTYLENVLTRTIEGIDTEIAQLRYLLGARDPDKAGSTSPKRMRPAI